MLIILPQVAIRELCEHHDDGHTTAAAFCQECQQHLCAECDHFSHLRSAARGHVRRRLEASQPAVTIEQHENCIRMKCASMLVTVDIASCKAILEFKAVELGPLQTSLKCRFCGSTIPAGALHVTVCEAADCQELVKISCNKLHACGHTCGGVAGELSCLPCLHGCDAAALQGLRITQDHEDQCMICFTSAISEEPCVHLQCGHLFHFRCTQTLLGMRWSGPRVTFGFAQCPICKASLVHDSNPLLKGLLAPLVELFAEVRRKALLRLEYDGLAQSAGRGDDERVAFAMNKYAYYICFKCKKAYFGGEGACEVARDNSDFNPEELVCGSCVGGLVLDVMQANEVIVTCRSGTAVVQQARHGLSGVQVPLLLLGGGVLLLRNHAFLQPVPRPALALHKHRQGQDAQMPGMCRQS